LLNANNGVMWVTPAEKNGNWICGIATHSGWRGLLGHTGDPPKRKTGIVSESARDENPRRLCGPKPPLSA
jgi:hypothetical protein